MKAYMVEIKFEKEKHCLQCPLRDDEYDGCNLQVEDGCYIQFENWEEQMKNCPLKELLQPDNLYVKYESD